MKTIEITRNGMKLHTISIEDDCQIRINDVEIAQKYIPKKGDCVKSVNLAKEELYFVSDGNKSSIGIIFANGIIHEHLDEFNKTVLDNQTQVTPEELQAEFEKAGFVYDFKTHTAKKLRWKPKMKERYYHLVSTGVVSSDFWTGCPADNARFDNNNCHQTEQSAEKFRAYMRAYEAI